MTSGRRYFSVLISWSWDHVFGNQLFPTRGKKPLAVHLVDPVRFLRQPIGEAMKEAPRLSILARIVAADRDQLPRADHVLHEPLGLLGGVFLQPGGPGVEVSADAFIG